MKVPKGGSSCATCEYYDGKGNCENKYFQEWNGSPKIPAPSPDEYCSDWYEPEDYKALMQEYKNGQQRKKD